MARSNELSSREQEVVQLLLEGKSNKLIASALGISESTVEFHLKKIYAKFQVRSRMELVLKLGNGTNLKLGQSIAADKGEDAELRQSTVAGEGDIAENRDGLNVRKWVTTFREAVSSIGKEKKMENVLNSNTRDEAGMMTFFESIRVCLTKYAEFNGQATRPEFWWFALFIILAGSALAYLNQTLSDVFLIAMLLPFLAVGARRLHDTGKSGWWQLFILVPVAGIVLLGFLWAVPSTSAQPNDTIAE
jgi:DNA-binding CsgD family transcriptional regulator